MAKFDEFTSTIKTKARDIFPSLLREYKEEALKDAKDNLKTISPKLQRWTNALADGSLSKEDFEWLVESLKDVMVLNALEQKGLAKVRIDGIKYTFLNMVIDTAFDMFA